MRFQHQDVRDDIASVYDPKLRAASKSYVAAGWQEVATALESMCGIGSRARNDWPTAL